MRIIYIFLFVFIGFFAFSQNDNDIEFLYDENGNRTERKILPMGNKSLESADTTDYNENTLKEKLSVIDKLGNTQINFFPNPVKQWLNIEVSGAENWKIGEYSLFSNTGKLIDQGHLGSNNRLDFKNYSPSLYLLEISIDGEKQVWKILKD